MPDAPAPRALCRGLWWLGHALALAVVLSAVAAQVLRPLAPDLGAPPDPGAWFGEAYIARAAAYRRPLQVLGLVVLLVQLAVPAAAAFTRPGRRLTGRLVARLGDHRPARAAAAVVVGLLVASDLALLPFAFWTGFVHEGAFGFRTQGLAGWSYDWTVTHVPVWALAGGLTVAGYSLIRRLPRAWPPVVGLLGAVVAGILVLVAPLVVQPLLLPTRPLPEGPTRQAVEEVLAAARADIDDIVVADASRRTTKHNAYITGLGPTRQVVLFDTLVAGHAPAEIGVVVAHELGHHRNHDLARGILFAAGGVVVAVYALAWLLRRRVTHGRQPHQAEPRAAALVVVCLVALTTVTLPLQSLASRRAEAAADLAALRLTEAPATYLAATEELARANLAEPLEPAWVRLLWSTHPPVVSRLELGARWPFEEQP